jgi:hypothetical protein
MRRLWCGWLVVGLAKVPKVIVVVVVVARVAERRRLVEGVRASECVMYWHRWRVSRCDGARAVVRSLVPVVGGRGKRPRRGRRGVAGRPWVRGPRSIHSHRVAAPARDRILEIDKGRYLLPTAGARTESSSLSPEAASRRSLPLPSCAHALLTGIAPAWTPLKTLIPGLAGTPRSSPSSSSVIEWTHAAAMH